jgi:hypothetical protein
MTICSRDSTVFRAFSFASPALQWRHGFGIGGVPVRAVENVRKAFRRTWRSKQVPVKATSGSIVGTRYMDVLGFGQTRGHCVNAFRRRYRVWENQLNAANLDGTRLRSCGGLAIRETLPLRICIWLRPNRAPAPRLKCWVSQWIGVG